MEKRLINKKLIAREILLVFGVLTLAGLAYIILGVRNYYFENKSKSYNQELKAINTRIDSPIIAELYKAMSVDFVKIYYDGSDSLAVSDNIKDFLFDDYPNAICQKNSDKGYFYFKGF